MRLLEISTDALGGVENYSVALPCFDEYQHAVVWHDDLFLFGRNGWVLVLIFGKSGTRAVQPSGDTNSGYLRFPTFFTGIFITLPHSSHFLPIYEKKATFQ